MQYTGTDSNRTSLQVGEWSRRVPKEEKGGGGGKKANEECQSMTSHWIPGPSGTAAEYCGTFFVVFPPKEGGI